MSDGPSTHTPGAVDEDVEPPAPGHRRVDRPLAVGHRRKVGHDAAAVDPAGPSSRQRPLEARLVAVDEEDAGGRRAPSRSTVARPMPDAPPVTSATRPAAPGVGHQYQASFGPLNSWIVLPPSTTMPWPVT